MLDEPGFGRLLPLLQPGDEGGLLFPGKGRGQGVAAPDIHDLARQLQSQPCQALLEQDIQPQFPSIHFLNRPFLLCSGRHSMAPINAL